MKTPNISLIIPVVERVDDLVALCKEYVEPFADRNLAVEVIIVLDKRYAGLKEQLRELSGKLPELKVIQCAKNYGEANALMIGFTSARADTVFTLSPYYQVVSSVIPEMLDKLDEGYDLVITRRHPRTGNIVNRMQALMFHAILHNVTQFTFSDISCGLRAMRVNTARGLGLSGNMHRFIPIIAHKQGKKVIELKATQRIEDTQLRFHGPIKYIARLIDIMCLFFVLNSTKFRSRVTILAGALLVALGSLWGICPTGQCPLMQVCPPEVKLGLKIFLIFFGACMMLFGFFGSFIRRVHAFDHRRECVIEAIIE